VSNPAQERRIPLTVTVRSDPSPNLGAARQIFLARHPMLQAPTASDLQALRFIASSVASRASSIVAAGIHALWELRNAAENISAGACEHTLVAYNGSVMEHYPGFRAQCQRELDGLVEASGGAAGMVELMYAKESSLVGAAVAVACLDER
jgi:hexokinase